MYNVSHRFPMNRKLLTVTLVLLKLYFADNDKISDQLLTSRLEDEDELLTFDPPLTSNVSLESKELDGRQRLHIAME